MRAPFAVVLLAAGMSLVPLAAAKDPPQAIAASSGTPINPQCAPDNGDESTRVEADGTMFLPNDGCSAAYDIAFEGDSHVTMVQFKVTGHEGEMCGSLSFEGSLVGRSATVCMESAGSAVATVPARTVPGVPGSPLVMTWHPTLWEHDNAYVCWLEVVTEADVGSPDRPECFEGGGGPPSPCTVLWAEDNGDGSVTVTWPPYPGATGYQVQQRRIAPGEPGFAPVAMADAGATSYTATGLADGATYGFAVTPQGDDAAWSCAVFSQSTGGSGDGDGGGSDGGGVEIPFFPSASAWAMAAAGALGSVWLVRRRRQP